MGWSFDDYDNATAIDIETLVEIWRIDQLHKDAPANP